MWTLWARSKRDMVPLKEVNSRILLSWSKAVYRVRTAPAYDNAVNTVVPLVFSGQVVAHRAAIDTVLLCKESSGYCVTCWR